MSLTPDSIILSSILKSPSGKFKSHLLNFFLKSCSDFSKKIAWLSFFKRSYLYQLTRDLPWSGIIIFLFVISLSLAPESQVQLSSISSARINLSQRQYGVVLFSLSNILLIPLLIILVNQFRTHKLNLQREGILLIFFIISLELSSLNSINIQASLISLIKVFYWFIIYFIFSNLLLDKRLMKIIIYALLFTIFLEGFLAILQFLKGGLIGIPLESAGRYNATFENMLSPAYLQSQFRAIGTLAQPNTLSSYLGLLFPISLVFMYLEDRRLRIFAAFATIICLIASVLAFSRWGLITNIFAFFLTFGFLARFIPHLKTKVFGVLKTFTLPLLAIMGLLVVGPFFVRRFLNFPVADQSLSIRIGLIEQAIAMIKEFPAGVGPGGFLDFFTNYDYTSSSLSKIFLAPVHNFYLLIIAEGGIITLSSLLIFQASIIITFIQKVKTLSEENRVIVFGLFVSFITFFFNGLWTMRSFEDRVGFLFALILGLLVNIIYRKSQTLTHNYQ